MLAVAGLAGVPHDPHHDDEQIRRRPLCFDCGSRDTWWGETSDGEVLVCNVCTSCDPDRAAPLVVPPGPPVDGFDGDDAWDDLERAVIERVLAEIAGWRAQGASECTITIEVSL